MQQDNLYTDIISRHIINPDMVFFQHDSERKNPVRFDYKHFCDLIDYWKILLVEKYQAEPGKTVLIEFNLTNAYYYSSIFAALELGLILIIDFPHAHNQADVTSYRMTMHGKIDYAIVHSGQTDPMHLLYSYWDLQRTLHNCNQVITEKDFDSYEIQDHALFSEVSKKIFARPDTTAIWSASGGTTGLPKKIVISHKKTFRQAQRLVGPLGFKHNDKTLHVRNLHHGASMCYHFLPSWMVASEHYTMNYRDITDLPAIIEEHKISKVLLYTNQMLNKFLHLTHPLAHDLDIVTLFNVTKQDIELIKEKNIKSVKVVFGDTTIGLGFFAKSIDQSTDVDSYEANNMGPKLDNFFDLKIQDNMLWISIPELSEDWTTSFDKFELVNGNFYFHGRSNQYRFGPDWLVLGEIEAKVEEFFGPNNATIVIDNDLKQIYLAVWDNSQDAIESFKSYVEKKYEVARINKIAQDLDYDEFLTSRKIDRQRLRDYFRSGSEITP